MKKILTGAAIAATLLASAGAYAASGIPIEMKDGRFNPATIEIPANQKVTLTIKNSEKSEVEFESYELNREEKIKPGASTTVYVGPLEPGSYPVFDDNNPDAKGVVVVK